MGSTVNFLTMGPLYSWIRNQTINQFNLKNPFLDLYSIPEYTDPSNYTSSAGRFL
jgi:hypothetical protein